MTEKNLQFAEELNRLNAEQKKAVETTEGPVLVIAGPGTGKTQILAARVGYILQTTDTPHESILCLTYTDAGTIAMRKRLIDFIGPDAYKIPIHTFHSFCNLVIQENQEFFGTRELSPISDLEKVEVLHELIDEFGPDHPLKRWTGEFYFEASRMSKLFDVMKTENLSAELIRQKCEEYLEDLPNRDEYVYKRANSKTGVKIGDVKQKDIDAERDKLALLIGAAGEFAKYEEKLRKRGRYDFNDMILWVIDKFKTQEHLLLRYQEKFLYILVDEFQDTSGSQNAVLEMLLNYWDEPNIFVVGDDDQSIYRFQGANVQNILDFADRYSNMERIVLKENYRSTQAILDSSMAVIGRNKQRLVNELPSLTKNLTAKNPDYTNAGILPEVREYANDLYESADIGREIEEQHLAGKDLSQIAILYRNHKQCDDLVRFFQQKNIPYNIRKRSNVLDSPFAKKIITLLRYVAAEHKQSFSGDHFIFEMLHYEFFKIDAIDIANFALEIKSKSKQNGAGSWRRSLSEIPSKAQGSLFEDEDDKPADKLRKTGRFFEKWIESFHEYTLQGLFEYIITSGGIISYIMESSDQRQLMEELRTVFDLIKDYTHKDPTLKLSGFLELLDMMCDYDIALPQQKISSHEKGVHLMTAHSSKGLEFERVYILGCDKNTWQKTKGSGTYMFPDTLVRQLKENEDADEENRRLFYVAMTRAKKELIVSYASNDMNAKVKESCVYLSELVSEAGISINRIQPEDDVLIDLNLLSMSEAPPAVSKLMDPEQIKPLLQNYRLSVTHLNTYLKCPLSFYFSYVLQIPSAKKASMEFGSAVHEALYHYFERVQESKKFPPANELISMFEYEMKIRREGFTDKEYEQKLAYGREFLPKYYKENLDQWSVDVLLERRINDVVVDGIPIKGVIDKIELSGKDAVVIDYKTGRYENSKHKFNMPATIYKKPESPTHEELHGGDYWRQGVFYKVLIDNYQKMKWNVVCTRFDFVEPDQKSGKFQSQSIAMTEEELSIVKKQIRDCYAGIMRLEFEPGCGEKDCYWCNFVKNNFKSLDLPAQEIETSN